MEDSLKREKARRIVQSKYLNEQMSRPLDNRRMFEQRVSPNYQTKTVSYGPPPDSSFRTSNFKKSNYDTFENVVSQHAKPTIISKKKAPSKVEVIGKKEKKKEGDKEGKSNPNMIEFSNKNGPETFTITHKT